LGLIKRDGIDHPEISFAFLTQYRYCRQGYGYESAQGVINYANNRLTLKHLQAICNPDNEAYKALLQRLGFSFNKT
jgi:ribosomal-protein-alanine N-acetyltransferase